MSEIKLCKDCKHFRRAWLLGAKFDQCANPAVQTALGMVRGTPSAFCDLERGDSHTCGRKGELFESKRNRA